MKNKFLLAIWSQHPENYFYINNIIHYLKKKNKSPYLFFQKKIDADNHNYRCATNKTYASKINFLNKIYFVVFILKIIMYTIFNNPNKIILFNKHALIAVFILRLFYNKKIVYHNFDYDPFSKGLIQSFLNFCEKKAHIFFDFIIFSNNVRGKIYIKNSNVDKKKIFTIYNTLSRKNLKNIYNIKKKKITLFRIGSIGPGHSLLEIIYSMKYLNKNFNLVLFGQIVDESYYNKIKEVIKKNNLNSKIKLKINVKEKIWKRELNNASLGLAMYEKNNLSHKYMMGASQKINAYFSAGIPIIVLKDKQFYKFDKKNNPFIFIKSKNPKLIYNEIRKISKSNLKYKQMCKNSKKIFHEKMSFEADEKILRKILLDE